MTDWPNYLTVDESGRLAVIDRQRKALKRERDLLANRARQRKHAATKLVIDTNAD